MTYYDCQSVIYIILVRKGHSMGLKWLHSVFLCKLCHIWYLLTFVKLWRLNNNTNITGDGNEMGWCNLFRLGRQAHFNWNAAMESASHQLLQLIKSGNLCSSIAAFPSSLLEINQFLHRTQTRWDPGREFLSFVLAETYDWFEAALNTKMNCPSPALSLSLSLFICAFVRLFSPFTFPPFHIIRSCRLDSAHLPQG